MASRDRRRAGALLAVLLCAGCAPEWRAPWLAGRGDTAPDGAPAEAPAGPPAEAPAGTAPSQPEPAAAARDETGSATLSDFDRAEIDYLLNLAEWAIRDDHLTYPAKDSAFDLYQRVQAIDPDNDDARRGLERIVERYLEMAMIAGDGGDFGQAGTLLDRARLVQPDHPGIGPTQARIGLLSDADRQVITLDGPRLKARDPQLGDSLRQAGLASRGDGCRAEITARNDAEGRWIYQQMSQRGQARIQAQLSIGSPPRVEVMCFPEQAP